MARIRLGATRSSSPRDDAIRSTCRVCTPNNASERSVEIQLKLRTRGGRWWTSDVERPPPTNQVLSLISSQHCCNHSKAGQRLPVDGYPEFPSGAEVEAAAHPEDRAEPAGRRWTGSRLHWPGMRDQACQPWGWSWMLQTSVRDQGGHSSWWRGPDLRSRFWWETCCCEPGPSATRCSSRQWGSLRMSACTLGHCRPSGSRLA
jgi:hypothetical protein